MPIIKLTELLRDAKDGDFEYCCLMLSDPDLDAAGIAADLIDPVDVYEPEGGIEDQSHITLLWGLTDNDSWAAQEAIFSVWDKLVKVMFGMTMIFEPEGKDYEVVVVDVESDDLHELHGLLLDALPNEQTHSEYRPHMTLAYVKRGTGAKYDDIVLPLTGLEFVFNTVDHSSKDGGLTELKLIN